MRHFIINPAKATILIVLSVFIFLSCSQAQTIIPMPKLEANVDGKKELLLLSGLDIQVSVTGNIASTTLDMTFLNKTNRVLEGELEFPLGEGQTISRYALDFDERLREGVIVEKAKGRQVFEGIVRKGVDPGLAEMTRGNHFKTRVYPIPAQGTRRVVIAYEQELKNIGGKKYYSLPLQFDQEISKFSIQVQVFKQSIKPKIEENPFNHFTFESWNEGYQAIFTARDYTLDKNLSFQIPEASEKGNIFTEDEGLNTYFYLVPSLFVENSPKKLPEQLTLIYDVSSSSEKRNQSRELELLKSYIDKLGKVTIRLVTFSNSINLDTLLNSCDFKNISEIIQNQKYDGGTQLGCLDFSKFKCDEIILFTDGISNFGVNQPVNSTTPVMIINSNPSADHSVLRRLAQMNSGNYINLCALTMDEAKDVLSSNPYRFISAEYNNKIINEVFPFSGQAVNESFSVAGIMKAKEANITLNFGFGNRITKSYTYKLSTLENNQSVHVKRIWAQKKLTELDVEFEKNKQEITSLAKKYGIVTRNTSLIVLDRVEDYVRYEITPPAELLDEYNRLVSLKPKEKKTDTLSLSPAILTHFEEFETWWNTDFKPKPVVKKTPVRHYSGRTTVRFTPPEVTNEEVPEEITTQDALDNTISEVQGSSNANSVDIVDITDKKTSVEGSVNLEEQVSTYAKPSSRISLQSWNPDAKYISELKRVPDSIMYDRYLELKKDYSNSPSFYMDVADYFNQQGLNGIALRILSNLAELKMEDPEIMRSLGNKLIEMGRFNEAVNVYNEVLRMREEEPQAYRDLALAYSLAGNIQKAIDLLYQVVKSSWDDRFEGVQQIALNEMNALIASHPNELDLSKVDPQLLKNFPLDIRIVLTWNTNNCDVDLWVTDPRGEKCDYSHNRTEIGGRMSRDITQGYGPEEFCLKNALTGNYKIQVNYYGNYSQKLLQPVTIQVKVFTNFGHSNQKQQLMTLRLENVKNTFDVGTIKFEKGR